MVTLPELSERLVKRMFNLRFALSRLCRFRIFNWIADKALFDGDDIYYLPKDASVKKSVRIDVDIPIEDRKDLVLPSDAAEELIKRSRYHYLMNFCICRRSAGCRDYPIEYGCIFLGKGVKNIRGDVGRMVTEKEALTHLRKAREAGLVQLIGRNKIDSVWLNSGRKEDLLSICNCCPCCCLWKIIPDLPENISDKITKVPGMEISVDENKCTGCGECQKICFVKAIKIVDGKCNLDSDMCRGCGRCVEACPSDAIIVRTDKVCVDEVAEHIASLVDLTGE